MPRWDHIGHGLMGILNSYWPLGSRKVTDAGRSSQYWNWEILRWIGNGLLQNSWALIGSHVLTTSLGQRQRGWRCSDWNSCCCCLGLIPCRTLPSDIGWKDEVLLRNIKRGLKLHDVEGLFEPQVVLVSVLIKDFR